MDIRLQKWLRLPIELRERKAWCLGAPDKSPWYVINGRWSAASVVRPDTWMDFQTAVTLALQHNCDIGYVLSNNDPFAFIDLDVKDAENCPNNPEKWTTADRMDEFYRAITTFDSYAERSRSGKGFHICVRGTVDKGMKKGDVEVYSNERFIICTGSVVRDVGVNERQELLTRFVDYYRGQSKAEQAVLLTDGPEVEDDWSVLLRLHNSGQRDKFERLWNGDFSNYPSQSEADAALLQMLCFISENNTQVGRIFLNSALGKREKAHKDNYLYLRRSIARARTLRNADKNAELAAIAQSQRLRQDLETGKTVDVANAVAAINASVQPESRVVHGIHSDLAGSVSPAPLNSEAECLLAQPVTQSVVNAVDGIPWPPGVMGAIAQFIYRNSVRPAKEVSIVSAIGVMAGICGKAWHIPQSGLNMYVVLIAKSAVGKEAMHTGISTLLKAVMQKGEAFKNFAEFFDFTEYQSGPALIKRCAEAHSFVNIQGEWGKRLKRMAQNDTDGPLSTLRTQMTNLYQKSGPQSITAGMGYSDSTKNVSSTSGVAYSMIGETTPQTYYDALTPSMMEDGFLSRFLMIEYKGKRVPMNHEQELEPSPALVDWILKLGRQAHYNYNNKSDPKSIGSVLVKPDDEARQLIRAFENECDDNINSTDDESRRQMWNRASLKSLRLAALCAVGDNFERPVICRNHVEWAQLVIRKDIESMTKRLDQGDVGVDDKARERKVVAIMQDYLLNRPAKSYKVNPLMRDQNIITRNYISLRVGKVSSFTTAREGAKRALDMTIMTCIDNGYIMEVSKTALSDNFNYLGKAYRILDLPDYDALDHVKDSL